MNKVTEKLLQMVSDWKGAFDGAYNIREDGECAGRVSSKNIQIDSKSDGPGLVIHIEPETKGETVYHADFAPWHIVMQGLLPDG